MKSQLRRVIHDPDVLWLLDLIIDSTDGPGIPIGNHTSQWFAILYLSGMDHMIKERLGIKFYGPLYGRLLSDPPGQGIFALLSGRNQKVPGPAGAGTESQDGRVSAVPGIDFLGFRTYMTDSGKVVRKLRRESKNRIRRKLKKFRHLLDEGRITFETVGPVLFFLGRPRRTRQQLPPDQEHGRTVLRPVQKRNGGISCQNNCRRFLSARS